MSIKILNEILLGDMKAVYLIDDTKNIPELQLIPNKWSMPETDNKNRAVDSLVQIKIVGDTYSGGYAGGNTMRQSFTVDNFKYRKQEVKEGEEGISIQTCLVDPRGYETVHYLDWKKEEKTVKCHVSFTNRSKHPVVLEMLSSFSLSGISPLIQGVIPESIRVHRIRSVWSMEGRIETQSLEELQLEPSWAGHAIRCERFGQCGSLPVNKYFPWLVVEDLENKVFWGMQLAHNASWQMELYRKDDGLSASGGLSDREFGQWMKTVKENDTFYTPEAILTVDMGGTIDGIAQRLTTAQEQPVQDGADCEKELPIIFNEYCTTWGCPSHDNIAAILEVIKDKGFTYFVIDCGWYKEDGIPWDISMGDYHVSKELFPDGLQKTVDLIKQNGLKPGIWFEIDNVGEKSKAYQQTEHLLHRDGHVLTTSMRRFWNMNDPWVVNYLSEKVIGTLKKYGFEYMKMDYNDTIGIGCDDADGLGEGLRKNMKASVDFIKKIKQEIPELIIENCASGGQKQEPLMMGLSAMSSFSDAHECEEIPIIAANLHRTILPRQSQIWAVIRETDSIQRIVYSIASTFLGRMCISGDVTKINEKQWIFVDNGITFYKKISPIIKKGTTFWYGPQVMNYRYPTGWQGILRISGDGNRGYLVIHTFHGELPDKIEIIMPHNKVFILKEVYSHDEYDVKIEKDRLIYYPKHNLCAVAMLLES